MALDTFLHRYPVLVMLLQHALHTTDVTVLEWNRRDLSGVVVADFELSRGAQRQGHDQRIAMRSIKQWLIVLVPTNRLVSISIKIGVARVWSLFQTASSTDCVGDV